MATCWACDRAGILCPTCGLCLTCHPEGAVFPETDEDIDPLPEEQEDG